MFLGSLLIPFPGSFSPGNLAHSSAWGGSPGFSGVSWALLFALTFRYCPQHLGPHHHILQTDCSEPSPVQDFFSLPCSPLSPHGQNLDPSSSSPPQTPMVFTWGVLEVGPHRHVLRFPHLHPPQELTQRTLSCRRRPQLHQRDTQPEKLSKHHISLSSHSSCLRFSPSYIFVVNGPGGK